MKREKPTTPNWDKFNRKPMFVPFFVYGRDDLDVAPLDGFCRGFGALIGGKRYQDTIGIYTAEGVYYNLLIDHRLKCAVPTFFIEDTAYFYPIVACLTMCGGVPAVDPATGIMRTTSGDRP